MTNNNSTSVDSTTGEKKDAGKKNVFFLQITCFLFNYTSTLQNLKSLTQLGTLATQKYYRIQHPADASISRIHQNVSMFSDIKLFGETMQF
jgi:hypothetical protein